MCMCVPFCNIQRRLLILSLCYLKQNWYFTVRNHNEEVNFSRCGQHDGCFFLMFVSVISKLIKPYHCCVYGSFCHICSCINANKDVWLVLSGMMAISSGKKCSQFCCAVVVQEQRLILCLSCFIVLNGGLFLCCGLCSKKLHSQWWPISLSERKD